MLGRPKNVMYSSSSVNFITKLWNNWTGVEIMHKTYPDKFPTPEKFREFLVNLKSLKYHEAAIDLVLRIVREIPSVECVILKGSLGKSKGDIFSDIDFYVIHQGNDEDSIHLRDEITEKVDATGKIVQYFPSTVNHRDCIIYLEPFIKFELGIQTVDSARISWSASIGKVLFDRNGVGAQIQSDTADIKFSIQDNILPLQTMAFSVPTWCYIVAGMIVRGEHVTALNYLNWVRDEMLKCSSWLLNQWDEGPRRAESRYPEEVLGYYHSSFVSKIEDSWHALDVFLQWYENWMGPIFKEQKLNHSLSQVETIRLVMQFLKEKSGM